MLKRHVAQNPESSFMIDQNIFALKEKAMLENNVSEIQLLGNHTF